jgi:hypothetical protein
VSNDANRHGIVEPVGGGQTSVVATERSRASPRRPADHRAGRRQARPGALRRCGADSRPMARRRSPAPPPARARRRRPAQATPYLVAPSHRRGVGSRIRPDIRWALLPGKTRRSS